MHKPLTLKPRHPLVRYSVFALIALAGMIVFFGPTDNWRWDPSFYYAHIRSPLIENDLDFRNETDTGEWATGYTATGLQDSVWPIGPSLLWSPFFLAAHGAVLLTKPGQADGFYFPYISLVSLGSAAYGVCGLFVVYRLCRYFSSVAHSLAVTLLSLGATPLFFYLFRQPIMAHTTGLLASATTVLVYLALSEEKACSPKSGLLFGTSLGLCFLTRWTGLLAGIVPAVYFIDHLVQQATRTRSWRETKRILLQVLIAFGVFFLTISPQLVLWYRLHSSFLAMPQPSNAFVDSILPVNLLKVLVHTNRGLVFWCPFVLMGMAGIALIPDLRVRRMAAVSMICHLGLIGYRVDWFSGGGFGARYFIETLPFTAIGFACLLRKLPARTIWKNLIALCVVALLVHQFVLMYAVEHSPEDGWMDLRHYLQGEPLGVGWQLRSLVKLAGNPSLWFAPRPYVGVDRQTILTNVRSGVGSPDAYLVTGTAAILAPILIVVVVLLQRLVNIKNAHLLSVGTMAFLLAWSAYLFFVG